MSALQIVGTQVVYGVRAPKPITGLPAGRVRIRMRKEAATKAYVRLPEGGGIRCFILEDKGDTWAAFIEEGANIVKANKP